MHSRSDIREAIGTAARYLADAGIASAQVDAELLAAHVAGVDRSRLAFLDVPGEFTDHYRELVDARARRIPLQHLTGVAPFGPLMLHVGPGVFIPRPETESLLEWATTAVAKQHDPFIVDLCTGTGALAVALARHRRDATVIAVDDSADALRYANRNAAGTAVELVEADVTNPACCRVSTAESTFWCAIRRIFLTVQNSNPKWPNTIRTTRCSGAPTAWR